MSEPKSNMFLDALPVQTRERILRSSEQVMLPVRTPLFEGDDAPRYVHFMTGGLASIVNVMASGEAVEVGLIGHEGIPEKVHLLGTQTGATCCFMQVEGSALRMKFKQFQEEFNNDSEVRQRVLQSVQYEALSLAQLSACNRLHEVEERLARWLLMVQDRVGDASEINLTQEFLGEMLGTRRSTVNIAAGILQRAGIIEYRRGSLTIYDRAKLEGVSCECYSVIKRLFQSLYS